MKRYRFACKTCGIEYRLQAWKAVCPSCKSEFTLELVAEDMKHSRMNVLILVISIIAYSGLIMVLPSFSWAGVLLPVIPPIVVSVLTLLLAVFVYFGAEPALWVSAIYGFLSILALALAPRPESIPQALLGLTITATASLYLAAIRRYKSRLKRYEDGRAMPEFSGWAGG